MEWIAKRLECARFSAAFRSNPETAGEKAAVNRTHSKRFAPCFDTGLER